MIVASNGRWSRPDAYLPDVILDAARLYQEVVTTRKHEFASLSEPQLLWILSFVMRLKYGYRFFVRALECAAMNIADASDDASTKAIALFILGTIGVAAGDGDAFKYLVDLYQPSEIPFVVALAVGMETDRQKSDPPSSVRSFNRRTRKLLRARSEAERISIDRYLDRLFGKKIDARSSGV